MLNATVIVVHIEFTEKTFFFSVYIHTDADNIFILYSEMNSALQFSRQPLFLTPTMEKTDITRLL